MTPGAGLGAVEAHAALSDFAARRGEAALRLAMHAALPQLLHPALLHALRASFVDGATALAVSDLLLAPFTRALGNDWFEIDRRARALLLARLQAEHAGETPPRRTAVADFVLAWLDRERRRPRADSDRLYRGWIEVERWNALAHADSEAAAEQLAQALQGALADGAASARLRIGALASALAEPLAAHDRLLAYAAGVAAAEAGDHRRAGELLAHAGTREIAAGGVRIAPHGPAAKWARVDMVRRSGIFISHIGSLAAARRLRDDIAAWGLGEELVLDEREIAKDSEWTAAVTREQMARRRAMVFVVGRRQLRRLNTELFIVFDEGLEILPVLLDGAELEPGSPLRQLEPLRLSHADWAAGVAAVVQRLAPDAPPPRQRRRVLLAATVRDLEAERAAIRQLVNDLGDEWIDAPRVSSSIGVELAAALVARCDVLVVLVGWRYGHVPDDRRRNPKGLSVVELELDLALAAGKPVLAFAMRHVSQAGRDVYIDARSGEGGRGAEVERLRRRLEQHAALALFDNVDELRRRAAMALQALPAAPPPRAGGRVLLFVGHSIDREGRKEPRFPSGMQAKAAEAIDAAVRAEAEAGPIDFAAASGSDGGDVLFLEACARSGIPLQLYLPFELHAFRRQLERARAGVVWIDRLDRLSRQARVIVPRPRPSADEDNATAWQRNSEAMLQAAVTHQHGVANVVLIALWDGQPTESPGGPTYLIARAHTLGIRTVRIDTRSLFGLTS